MTGFAQTGHGTRMRYALISDIHANLPALEAVLEDIEARENVAATYHLGDLVGYAPWPNETVALIRGRAIAGVAGNYDSTVATDYKHCGCQYDDPRQEALSHQSYDWTRAHVTAETKQFLSGLPFAMTIRPAGGHLSGPSIFLVHGHASLNTIYVHEQRSDDFLTKMGASLGARAGDAVCFGHTHKPWHRVVSGIHFVNTGSVGRPKDGDWRAGYVLLDTSADGVSGAFIRVAYDVERATEAIVESELPNEFAEMLTSGGTLSPTSA